MIKKDTPNINCAYLWLNHVVSPEVNAQIAEYFGEAPANQKSCALTKNKDHCTVFHAEETDFWSNVYYWTTPVENCVDGRTDVKCVAYDEWVRAWCASCAARDPTAAGDDRHAGTRQRHRRGRPACTAVGCCTGPRGCGSPGCSPRRCCGSCCSTSSRSGCCSPPPSSTPTASPAASPTSSPPRTSSTCSPPRPTCSRSLRTVGVAVGVTLLCALLALPLATYTALVSRRPGLLVALVLTPLWASYLVKVYAWRILLAPEGPLGAAGPGYGWFAVVAHADLPVAALHGAAAARGPDVDARLLPGGRRGPRRPAVDGVPHGGAARARARPIAAGSVFTFSLSLGDYITVQLVGGTGQMLGNLVYQNFSTDLPFAAAVAVLPLLVMAAYLLTIRRTGALDRL